MLRRRSLALAAAALLLAVPTPSQPQGVNPQVDSLTAQARSAGREAADRATTWPFFGLALVPGAAFGYFGAIAAHEGFGFFDDVETRFTAMSAGALLLTIGLARWTAVAPAADRPSLAGRPSSYQSAFREAYVQRVRQRRTRATLWGGLTGAAVGLGFLALVAAAVD